MGVSQRTRFEVFRRDNYTCRYCRSTESPLTVDHVTPVSLGGTDDPSNLVTACKDCNAGKGSSAPDAPVVAQVAEDALRWSAAIRRAASELAQERSFDATTLGEFFDYWNEVTVDAHLPANWDSIIRGYLARGLTLSDLEEATNIAFAQLSPYSRHHFRYFCGVCRNKAEAIAERARQILSSQEDSDGA